MFKLKLQNVAFWGVAPSVISYYSYQSDMAARIDNLWRIHQNRKQKGMGGSFTSTGIYDTDDHTQDRAWKIHNGFHTDVMSLLNGQISKPMLDNPFTRFHDTIVEYPDHLSTVDDYNMFQTDNFERFKATMPKDESVVGNTTLIPMQDTDEKLQFYDV